MSTKPKGKQDQVTKAGAVVLDDGKLDEVQGGGAAGAPAYDTFQQTGDTAWKAPPEWKL